jgi:predicted nucleotidyltransferase component of viral defense system
MIRTENLKPYFAPFLWENQAHHKYILKEYIQLLILDYLTTTDFVKKIVFIGGTNLRLVKGIDRFSEDLDFDCKNLSNSEFLAMTDGIVEFLKRMGFEVETRDKPNDKLKAYRRNIYFPELLFKSGLSGYKQERFLIKIENQDQQTAYTSQMATIKGCGLFFMFPVPADDVLCAMKVSALLSRQKGRDFYDVMFLLPQTGPDFNFLEQQCGINNAFDLKKALLEMISTVDLKHKSKDFEHLVFNPLSIKRVTLFKKFIEEWEMERTD